MEGRNEVNEFTQVRNHQYWRFEEYVKAQKLSYQSEAKYWTEADSGLVVAYFNVLGYFIRTDILATLPDEVINAK